LDPGQPCSFGGECGSGWCVDGVCCDSACNGTCLACNLAGNEGVCTFRSVDDNTECAACNRCTGLNINCQPENTADGYNCVDDCTRCSNGSCVDRPQWATAECSACNACDVAGGNCVYVGVCSPGTPEGCGNCGTRTCQPNCQWGSCTGQGVCAPGTPDSQNCGSGACLGTQTRTCQADCTWPGWSACSTNGNPCGNCGTCSGEVCSDQKANGQTCSVGTECCSGNCVDGVCCDSACGGSCQSCNLAGSVGTCTTRAAGDNVECAQCNRCDGINISCQPENAPDGYNCVDSCTYCSNGTCTTRAADDNTECLACNRCDGINISCQPENTADGYNCVDDCTYCLNGSCENRLAGDDTECLTCQACNIAGGNCAGINAPDGKNCVADCTECVGGVCSDRLQCNTTECTVPGTVCDAGGGSCQEPDANSTVCTACFSGWDSIRIDCCGDDGAADDWCTPGGGSCISGSWNPDHCLDLVQNCDEIGVDFGGFDCAPYCILPTVTTNDADGVEETTTTLKGFLDYNGDGPCDCNVKFQYGLTTAYGTDTNWQSATTGDTFYEAIYGLSKGTLYHFRAQAQNPAGSATGSDKTFLTKPDEPSNFTAIPENSQIRLFWAKGAGANRTMVRQSTIGYPATRTEGTQVYFDTGANFINTSLVNGTTYYYSAWSEVTADALQQYSDNYATTSATPAEAPACIDHNVWGWAWSSTTGWISFSCKNCDTDDNGFIDSGDCGGDNLTTPAIDYGVDVSASTGVFSGYAWSKNVGWITFNETDLISCPSGTCQAKLNFADNKIYGWAKAKNADGGYGWIGLRGQTTEVPPTEYGASWNPSTHEVEGWAWSDIAIGWISFNCFNDYNGDGVPESHCTDAGYASDYKVELIPGPNPPQAQTSCHPDGCSQPEGVCAGYTQTLFCLANDSTDPDGFLDITTSTWTIYDRNTGTVVDGPSDCIVDPLCNWTIPSTLSAGNYTAQLVVTDRSGNTSTTTKDFDIWQDAIADFLCSLTNKPGSWRECENISASEEEVVYFNDNLTTHPSGRYSRYSDGATSIVSRTWEQNGVTISSNNNSTTSVSLVAGSNRIRLTITDNAPVPRSDSQEYIIGAAPPLPEWREAPPL
ncbi:MAG: hypothetical protein ACE5WD_10910, partial [Candidatus Aminicenantia bacterium]